MVIDRGGDERMSKAASIKKLGPSGILARMDELMGEARNSQEE